MRWGIRLALILTGITAVGLLWAQKPFKEWPGIEYERFPLPSDAQRPSEWTRARLRYPDITGSPRASIYGKFPGYWTMDYPRSDRHLLTGVRRLTRIDTRSVEQVIEMDGSDEMYNWPVSYGVEVGHWVLPVDQAKQLREYLMRGGFLMVDDFHGTQEWNIFEDSLKRVFPDRDWVDLPVNDPVFHVLYDISERVQIPGQQFLESGRTFERDGYQAHWRGIYDDKGRIVMAICHNMDMGDAWEHYDDPEIGRAHV